MSSSSSRRYEARHERERDRMRDRSEREREGASEEATATGNAKCQQQVSSPATIQHKRHLQSEEGGEVRTSGR